MRRGRFRRSIGFDQDETRRVILLLKNVEARNAGFLHAGVRIRERGLLEGIYVLGFQMDMNMNDKHGVEIVRSLKRKR